MTAFRPSRIPVAGGAERSLTLLRVYVLQQDHLSAHLQFKRIFRLTISLQRCQETCKMAFYVVIICLPAMPVEGRMAAEVWTVASPLRV